MDFSEVGTINNMDGCREEIDTSFPGYYLDSSDLMDFESDSHCQQCPSGVVNGEHVDQSSDKPGSSLVAQNESPADAEAVALQNIEGPQEKDDDGNLIEDEAMIDGGVHPLLFPDVIKDVLNHLPAKDVENCRLVCRAWNTEACKVLRNKRLVVFVDVDAVRVYNNSMRDTVDFPHAQYEFCIQDFTGLVDENLREFWTLYGPHIKSLEFRQTHLFWRDFLEVVGERVPHLERLFLRHLPRNILRSRNVVNDEPQQQITSVKELRLASLPSSTTAAMERLTDLLKSLPNLEVIEFLPIKAGPVKTRVSNVLINILRMPDVNLPHLRRLNLNLELSNEGLDGLATKQFRLERLHISLSNGVKATSFKDLLCSLRSTLSELKISFPDSFSNYQSFVTQNNSMKPEECVQVLSNLKSLNMINFKGSINFVQKLPQLHHLQFSTSNIEKTIPFGFKLPNGRPSTFGFSRLDDHCLKFLKISTLSTLTVAETLTLESISRCFPYLTCLHMQGVDDDGLGVIYRNLPFLSDVEFSKATCTDQGLTGIPLEICNDMVETSTFIVVQAERYRRDLFIGSLQFLTKFSIVATKISDASIALGLVDCKNLKDLKIGSPQITDTGVIFVTDKFYKQLNSLDVSECTEITEQSKFYAREKLIGNLHVAESSPQDSQTQTKPKEVVFNANRGIVKTKRASTSTFGGSSSSHSKYHLQDTEFFEEHSEEDIRDRGFPHAAFPAEHNNRLRIIRIREALRRNGDFMRTLQRMGLQQFRRLYGREFQDVQADGPIERNLLRFRRRNLVNIELEDAVGDGQNHLQGQQEQAIEVILEEDDGGPAAGEVPDRLPEIHLNEIGRLGLRLDDVEYWLRNRVLFEREDGNPNIDPPILRQLRADVLLADMNLAEDAAHVAFGGGGGGGVGGVEDEDIDLDALRRVVMMNAFGEDLPFEG